MLSYKSDFKRAQQYWDAFWQKEIVDRPCAVVYAKKNPDAVMSKVLISLQDDFQKAFKRYDRVLESYEFLGEAIPGFRPDFGPDQMAGFMGAPIEIGGEETETSWSKKIVDDWSKFLPLSIQEDGPCWQRMIEFHKAAESYYRDKCLIYNIDLHSNIDTLEGLRGAEKLLFDLLDSPEVIERAMKDVRASYAKVFETFHAFGDKDRLGTGGWLPFYSRKRFSPIEADFICLLSPDLFRRFVMPALEEEAAYLDYSCFHLDGKDALKHLDDVLSIKAIDAIQWVPGAGAKPQLQWPEVLHKIQAAGKSIILYGTVDQIKAIHTEYKHHLVVYQVQTDSVEEGQRFLDWLSKNS